MPLRVKPGQLIASLPYLLPGLDLRNTLLLVPTAVHPRDVNAAAYTTLFRFDALRHNTTRQLMGKVSRLPEGVARSEMVLVAVGDGDTSVRFPFTVAIAALEAELAVLGMPVRDVFWSPDTTTGAVWRDYRHHTRSGRVGSLPTRAPLDAITYGLGGRHRPARWGIPFDPDGYAAPVSLSRFGAAVLACFSLNSTETVSMVERVLHLASSGDLPEDSTAFVMTALLHDAEAYVSALMVQVYLDPLRVEQLWLALYRAALPQSRPRLAALVAVSALLRGNLALATHALNHTTQDPITKAVAVCLRDGFTGTAAHICLYKASLKVLSTTSNS